MIYAGLVDVGAQSAADSRTEEVERGLDREGVGVLRVQTVIMIDHVNKNSQSQDCCEGATVLTHFNRLSFRSSAPKGISSQRVTRDFDVVRNLITSHFISA